MKTLAKHTRLANGYIVNLPFMNPKFRYLYITIGVVLLISLIVQVIMTYPDVSPKGVLLNALPALLFFYLAYKTYHEKKDSELM